MNQQVKELSIRGMRCSHCADTAAAALRQVPGVREAEVSLADQRARIVCHGPDVDDSQLVAAIHRAGYQAEPSASQNTPIALRSSSSPPDNSPSRQESVRLEITGMHCASCVGRVEQALRQVPGVQEAAVNLATGEARVEYDPAQTGLDALVRGVKSAGYGARYPEKTTRLTDRTAAELKWWRRRLVLGGVGLAMLLVLLFQTVLPSSIQLAGLLITATGIQLYLGFPFFQGAWRRLLHGEASMDTLITLGSSAAYLHGVAMAGAHAMMFIDAALILLFITLGRYLETRAKGRASAAIARLLDLMPAEGVVLRDGRPETVPLEEIHQGDLLLIRPGAKVPLDARILSGRSTVDVSWFTGEPTPEEKNVGDLVFAGTINGAGALTAQVIRETGDTKLAQVIELVRRAQESKTELQYVADRVVSYFVPAVLGIALITLLAWGWGGGQWEHGIRAAVAVLVVACPCALGLATPTAILVASGRGAELGIFIKEARALETAGRLTSVVLDKTGTVTLGVMRVVEIRAQAKMSDSRLLEITAGVQRHSGHPLAQAIVAEAEARNVIVPQAENVEAIVGRGVRATLEGAVTLVGNARWLEELGIDCSGLATWGTEHAQAGRTTVLVAQNGQLLGGMALADTPAPESRAAIEQLKKLKLKISLLTGDQQAVAQRVARELGIDQVWAQMQPDGKLDVIQSLRGQGETVAMVGDGINDAPAMAAADLGLAIGGGSDVAIEAADIVLSGNRLGDVPRAVVLARLTLRTIYQNLGWAAIYNLALLPLAAGLFSPLELPPIAAAAAMGASSVSVVFNSLRLRWRPILID